MAEIQFLISLSEKGKIDPLFSPGTTSYYWAGGNMGLGSNQDGALVWRDFSSVSYYENDDNYGGYRTNIYIGSGYSRTGIGVWTRCVYDEWYWAQYDEDNDPNKENDLDKLANPGSWGGYQTTIPDTLPIQN